MSQFALAGCGGWGKNLARVMSEMNMLGMIVDPAPPAKALATTLGVDHSDAIEMALANENISGVVIAAPAEMHHSLAIQSLDAGKHVYVEKPIALSLAESEEMASLARTKNLVLMVGHLLQYHPAFRALKNTVETGRLGTVHQIIASRFNLGVLRNEENVMWSFSPHDLSMVLGLVGENPVRAAMMSSAHLQQGIADFATVFLDFPSGVRAEIRSAWLYPAKEQKLVVVGSKAMATFDDRAPWEEKLHIKNYDIDSSAARPVASAGAEMYEVVPKGEPLRIEMEHFAECVQRDDAPLTGADEGIGVLRVMAAASRSESKGGAWVDV